MAISTSGIGNILGGTLGTFAGGPVGTAIGAGLGGAIGAGIEAIPTFMESDAEKENKRRLKELKQMQELGTLGLTEAEKQQLFTGAQGQIQGQLRQAQAGIRSAGAAGMGGAGTEALRQAKLAEGEAGLVAQVARDIEAKNLERKRELEGEIQERIATQADLQTARRQAVAEIAAAGVGGFQESLAVEKEARGKAVSPAEIAAYAKARKLSYDEAEAMISLEAKRPGMSRYGSIASEGV
jgi:hypothetical protein